MVLCLGIINAVNFMDGINGITDLYGLFFFWTIVMILSWNPFFESSMLYYLNPRFDFGDCRVFAVQFPANKVIDVCR